MINQTKEILLQNLRTTKLQSFLYLSLIVPMGVCGSLFNLLSLFILFKKQFRNIALFKYTQIYTLNSLIITVCQIFCFYFSAYHFYELSISFASRIFKCYVVPDLVLMCLFYANVLDLFINIERALYFSSRHEKFKQVSAYKISFVLFIVCALINLPSDLLYDFVTDIHIYNKMRLCTKSKFSETLQGKIIYIVSILIQGPFILILIVYTCIISAKSFKNYLKERIVLLRFNLDIREHLKAEKQKKILKTEKKLIFMTLCMSLFTIIYHLIQISSQTIIYVFNLDATTISWCIFVYVLIASLKHCSNIFIYCYFSFKFRKALKSFVSFRNCSKPKPVQIINNVLIETIF